MEEGLMSYNVVKVEQDLLDEIWNVDPRRLDATPGEKLTMYAVALAQYLIYFRYQRNLIKAEAQAREADLNRALALKRVLLDDKVIKRLKAKSDVDDYMIGLDPQLTEQQEKTDKLRRELQYLDGIDRSLEELIATIKRELTRRDNELYHLRFEHS